MDWLLVGLVLLAALGLGLGLAGDTAALFAYATEERMRTRWRLVGVPDLPQTLDVELQVDTTAPAVVEAIEEAASRNGVRLERLKDCGHTDGWVKGCPTCEQEERLAVRLMEGGGR